MTAFPALDLRPLHLQPPHSPRSLHSHDTLCSIIPFSPYRVDCLYLEFEHCSVFTLTTSPPTAATPTSLISSPSRTAPPRLVANLLQIRLFSFHADHSFDLSRRGFSLLYPVAETAFTTDLGLLVSASSHELKAALSGPRRSAPFVILERSRPELCSSSRFQRTRLKIIYIPVLPTPGSLLGSLTPSRLPGPAPFETALPRPSL